MASLDASAVAKLLIEFGQRIELSGDNPYRARAYYRAAESLRGLAEPLEDVIAQKRLRDIPGVGAALADRIAALHESGTHPTLEAMRREVPSSVLDMLRVPGLRPQQVLQLHDKLGISSLKELEDACARNVLKERKGFGPALQDKIMQGVDMMRRSQGQRLVHRAADVLDRAAAGLMRARPALKRVVAAGDLRRGCELVSDLALVAEAENASRPGEATRLGPEITLQVSQPGLYGATLLLATGSTEHVRQLQEWAKGRGLALSENGLRRGRRLIACRDEAGVYAALGLPFIAPELREGQGEIELAAAGGLPDLVEEDDLCGLLHNHTERSDGAHSLRTMAEATRRRGYAYFGVADHSKSAGYAGGLTLEEIEAQQAEVERLNTGFGGRFRIFKGIESDILEDGSLDYPDEVLGSFDYVVASVHSRFRLSEQAQTARIIRAVANPHTTILGHMTGRMLLRRPGYEVDVDAVLKACAEHEVAVEINCNSHRLDLDWRWHRRALELGCMMSINPDAHSTAELDFTPWGVRMARKGGVPAERVLNCQSLAELARTFEKRKARARKGGIAPGRPSRTRKTRAAAASQ